MYFYYSLKLSSMNITNTYRVKGESLNETTKKSFKYDMVIVTDSRLQAVKIVTFVTAFHHYNIAHPNKRQVKYN